MTRLLLTGLLALGLAMPGFTQTKQIVKELNDQLDSLRKDDDVLKSVLATHPTIAAARAKVQLACAELQQAELAIAQQLQTLKAEQEIARQQLTTYLQTLSEYQKAGSSVSIAETQAAGARVNEAKMGLTRVTASYESLIKPMKSEYLLGERLNLSSQLALKLDRYQSPETRLEKTAVENPPLSAVINKVVKMDAKGSMQDIVQALKEKAGYLGIIRTKQMHPDQDPKEKKGHQMELSGELSFSSWMDLILDEYNTKHEADTAIDLYVREYGLIVIERSKAPAGAVTLRDFAKASRDVKK